jgi:hypothetical protein
MRTLKELLLIFFVGMGVHKVVQDVLSLIDNELAVSRDDGYFSVIGFMVLYFGIKYLKQRDEVSASETKATN